MSIALISAALHLATAKAGIPDRYAGKLVTFHPKGFKQKVVALTFDDGPDLKITPKVLETLKKFNAKATFFVIGRNVVTYPKMLERIQSEGHEIGNHSYTHPSKPPEAKGEWEVRQTQNAIDKVIGTGLKLYRPPYGITNNASTRAAKRMGYVVVNWTNDTNDWKKGVDVYKTGTADMRPGEILLMHATSGKERTAAALPKIMEAFVKKGYRFVTMTEMLNLYAEFEKSMPKGSTTTGDQGFGSKPKSRTKPKVRKAKPKPNSNPGTTPGPRPVGASSSSSAGAKKPPPQN
jgi:peptidoglycan/xylan/chitin deacetylase (PgdA/CDA1 family)